MRETLTAVFSNATVLVRFRGEWDLALSVVKRAYHLIGRVRTLGGIIAYARSTCLHAGFGGAGWTREDRPFDSHAPAMEADVGARIGYHGHGCDDDPIRAFSGRSK